MSAEHKTSKIDEVLSSYSHIKPTDVWNISITLGLPNGIKVPIYGRDFDVIHNNLIQTLVSHELMYGFVIVELYDFQKQRIARADAFLILDLLMISTKCLLAVMCYDYFKLMNSTVVKPNLELNRTDHEDPFELL